nr:hypothetical protein [Candidatus Sigynarchaeota archaeon]
MEEPTPNQPVTEDPVGKILESGRIYVIHIQFETRDAAIDYAKRHGIKVKVTSYGY